MTIEITRNGKHICDGFTESFTIESEMQGVFERLLKEIAGNEDDVIEINIAAPNGDIESCRIKWDSADNDEWMPEMVRDFYYCSYEWDADYFNDDDTKEVLAWFVNAIKEWARDGVYNED